MNESLYTEQRKKLSLSIASEAVTFPFANFGVILRLGLIPSLIGIAVVYGIFLYLWPQGDIQNLEFSDPQRLEHIQRVNDALYLTSIVADVIIFVIFVIFAVGIHRFIIREERPSWLIFRAKRAEIVYATCAIILYVLTIAVATLPILIRNIVVHGVGLDKLSLEYVMNLEYSPVTLFFQFDTFGIIYILVIFTAVLFYARFALIFPHAAVEGRISFGTAWQMLSNNFMRLLQIIILFGIYIIIIEIILSIIVLPIMFFLIPRGDMFDFFNQSILITGVANLVYGIITAMLIALVSYTYKELEPKQS
jgi:hypothetical protein